MIRLALDIEALSVGTLSSCPSFQQKNHAGCAYMPRAATGSVLRHIYQLSVITASYLTRCRSPVRKICAGSGREHTKRDQAFDDASTRRTSYRPESLVGAG